MDENLMAEEVDNTLHFKGIRYDIQFGGVILWYVLVLINAMCVFYKRNVRVLGAFNTM